MVNPRSINIWYICGLSLCNFDCAYCASGRPAEGGSRTTDRVWLTEKDADRFTRILDWIARQPYSIGLRLQTFGEPFVSWDFLAGAARISRSPNIRFVELVSNGSLLSKRLPRLIDEHGANPAKLSLWVTHHRTEISAEELLDQACFARDLGISVIVNGLVFPDSLPEIRHLAALCKARGIRMNVDLGQNFNAAYGDKPLYPIFDDEVARFLHDVDADPRAKLAALLAFGAPGGMQCSAGHDYIHITTKGDIFPCRAYERGGDRTRIGSALDDDFTLTLRDREYAGCRITAGCICKEDFLHLRVARSPGPDARSLGISYSGTVPEDERAKAARRLRPIGKTRLMRTINALMAEAEAPGGERGHDALSS